MVAGAAALRSSKSPGAKEGPRRPKMSSRTLREGRATRNVGLMNDLVPTQTQAREMMRAAMFSASRSIVAGRVFKLRGLMREERNARIFTRPPNLYGGLICAPSGVEEGSPGLLRDVLRKVCRVCADAWVFGEGALLSSGVRDAGLESWREGAWGPWNAEECR